MTAQRTLVLLKPDAVQRGLRGEIIRRIEAKDYDIVALVQRTATAEELAAAEEAAERGEAYVPEYDPELDDPADLDDPSKVRRTKGL